VRPVALRQDASSDAVAGVHKRNLHLFSPLAPTTFVPTRLVRPAAGHEALEVRLMQGVQADDCADGVCEIDLAEDHQQLRGFVSYLSGMSDSVDV